MNLSSYLPLLIELMLKSAALLGVALLATRFTRSASAANRHLVWLAAFGVLLALPFTTARLSNAISRAEGATTVVVLELPARRSAPLQSAPMLAAKIEPVATGFRATADRLLGQWREGLVALWLGGAGLLLARRMFGAARLHVLRRRSEVVDDARIETWAARIARDNGLARPPELRVSTAFPVAITWGTWRPVVMLPAGARDWSDARIELVLRHELAHVARRDCLARLLSQVACALYWPNPLLWLAARHLRLAQEQACDDRVLAAGAEAPAYAAELLAAAQAWGDRATCGGAVSMAEPSTLERRILGVLGVARRDGARRGTMVCSWLAAGVVLAGASTVQVGERAPVYAQPETTVRLLKEGEPESALGLPKPPRDNRQIVIEARYLEVNTDAEKLDAATFFGEILKPGATTSPAVLGHLSEAEATRLIRELSAKPGSDLLSAPRVTVLNQNRATISVSQELRYPHSFDTPVVQQGDAAKFDSRSVGVETSVLPNVLSDGSVALEVQTMVREFGGFLKGPPATGGGTTPISDQSIFVPIFMERGDGAAIVLRPGEVAILRASEKKMAFPENAPEWARNAPPSSAARVGDTGLRAFSRGVFGNGEVRSSGTSKEVGGARSVFIFVSAKVINP
jgi:beta-lactamase regulating signal transducer with metallopeptidase domain